MTVFVSGYLGRYATVLHRILLLIQFYALYISHNSIYQFPSELYLNVFFIIDRIKRTQPLYIVG